MSINSHRQLLALAENHGLILLYHSIAYELTPALLNTVHNVTPVVFENHLLSLKKLFRFVSLDEFVNAKDKSGLLALTFDDGYANVLKQGLPILEKLNCPATLFVNPVCLQGSWNWRDKVRYVIANNLVDAFIQRFPLTYQSGRFYRYSKDPRNNSQQIDQALDKFLAGKVINIYPEFPYFNLSELHQPHPLLQFGNHGYRHFVLSSLTQQGQVDEINTADEFLQDRLGDKLSKCFSAPFGGGVDINEFTLSQVQNQGYKALLYSRQRLQAPRTDLTSLQCLERFMPRGLNIIDELCSLVDLPGK